MGGRGTGAKRAAIGGTALAGNSRSTATMDIRRSLIMLAGGRSAGAQTAQAAAPADTDAPMPSGNAPTDTETDAETDAAFPPDTQAEAATPPRIRSAAEIAMTNAGYKRVWEDASQTFYRHSQSRAVYVAMAGRVHPATAEQTVRLAQGQPPPRANERMSEAEVQAAGGTPVVDSWAGRVYEVRQVAGSVLPVKAQFRFAGPPADYTPTVAEADAVKAGYRLTVNDHQGRVYEKPNGEWLLYDYAPPRPAHMTEAQAQTFGYRLTEETAGERVYTKGADTARYAKAGYNPTQINAEVRQLLGLGGSGAETPKPRAGYRPSKE